MNRRAFAVVLALGLSTSMYPTDFSLPSLSLDKDPVTVAAAAAFLGSLYCFFATKPTDTPVRYSWEQVQTDKQTLTEFLYYLYLDGLVGHAAQSGTMKLDDDGKTVVVKKSIEAKGLFGALYERSKAVSKVVAFCLLSRTMWKALADRKMVVDAQTLLALALAYHQFK